MVKYAGILGVWSWENTSQCKDQLVFIIGSWLEKGVTEQGKWPQGDVKSHDTELYKDV